MPSKGTNLSLQIGENIGIRCFVKFVCQIFLHMPLFARTIVANCHGEDAADIAASLAGAAIEANDLVEVAIYDAANL